MTKQSEVKCLGAKYDFPFDNSAGHKLIMDKMVGTDTQIQKERSFLFFL